jgi:hypothetical protein
MIEKIRPGQLYGKQPLATIAMKINELIEQVNKLTLHLKGHLDGHQYITFDSGVKDNDTV